jgi:diguanylate cyclase
MRYAENREQSAEVLRMALAYMGRQSAAFNPCSFALWYEHCAGLNPDLSRTLEARLAAGSGLTDDDVWQLYTQHIITRDLQHYTGVRDELYRILRDTAVNAQAAGEKASGVDRALAGHSAELNVVQVPPPVREKVADLLTDTGKMRAIAVDLAASLEASTQEISVLSDRLQRAQTEARLDPLTGLRNRRGFEEAAQEITSQRGGLQGTGLLMADIDHFKRVNDEHGHLLGDKVLRAVAHVLKSNIKGRDVAARLGGEEFTVLLPETSIAGAVAVARHICSLVSQGRIKRPAGEEGTIGQVTLSVGVAVAEEGESLERLMERADAALYRAKEVGRNRVEVAVGGAAGS